jgi:hypothetical protein
MGGAGARRLYLVCLLHAWAAGAFTVGSDGWTVLTPRPDSLVIYVSSSGGNNSNAGTSAAAPVRTIAEGMLRLRSGFPDHLLLKRGDVWNEAFGFWSKSGRSAAEPMVVASYGPSPARPRVIADNEPGLRGLDHPVNYFAFTGIHLQIANRPSSLAPTGIRWLSPTRHFLIEDCLIEGFSTNVVVQGFFGPIEDFRIRRSVVVDAYDTGTLSQGMYCENVDGILIEECLFDHNGWRPGIAAPSIFNHNVYLHAGTRNLVATGNIFARASSHGLQARAGGTVENNLFLRCPVSLSYCYVLGGSEPTAGGIAGRVHGNVMTEGNDILDKPRGIGMQVGNIDPARGAEITNNFFLRNASAQPYGAAIELQAGNGLGVHKTLIQDNVCYGYNAGLTAEGETDKYSLTQVRHNCFMPLDTYSFVVHHRFELQGSRISYLDNIYNSPRVANSWFRANLILYSIDGWKILSQDMTGVVNDGGFPDPSRSVQSYSALQGFPATVAGYLTEARKQSRQSWRPACATEAVVDYLRVGFGGTPTVEYTLTTATQGSGSIALSPASATYGAGQVVTCTATPHPGHRFLYWEGDLLGALANPVQLLMNSDKTIRAVFVSLAEPLYSITLTVLGLGDVNLSPPGNAYPLSTEVTMRAVPRYESLGNRFMRYEGDVTGTTKVKSVTMSAHKNVTAVFEGVDSVKAFSRTGILVLVLGIAGIAWWWFRK